MSLTRFKAHLSEMLWHLNPDVSIDSTKPIVGFSAEALKEVFNGGGVTVPFSWLTSPLSSIQSLEDEDDLLPSLVIALQGALALSILFFVLKVCIKVRLFLGHPTDPELNYFAPVGVVFLAALFFDGLDALIAGAPAIAALGFAAAYELSNYTRGSANAYLTGELNYLNCDAGSPQRSMLLTMTNFGAFFPLAEISKEVGEDVATFSAAVARLLTGLARFYQGLWFNKKYRRTRKKIRHFFEKPIKVRRYIYLTCRWEARAELAWLGVPFRQYPQLKAGSTLLGFLIKKTSQVFSRLVLITRTGALVALLQKWSFYFLALMRRSWNNRPSVIHGFINLFQPEAPTYVRGGYIITPPRRPRLVNVVSDLEVFAGRGGSLLVFMFLLWSFFARILLVVCFMGIL